MPLQAIYENGVLRPLQPLYLAENEVVTLVINPIDEAEDERLYGTDDIGRSLLAKYQNEEPLPPGPARTFEEVQARFSHIPGSFADLINAERGEY